jgi:hypothetical protein
VKEIGAAMRQFQAWVVKNTGMGLFQVDNWMENLTGTIADL